MSQDSKKKSNTDPQRISKNEYYSELARLQVELVKLQEWIKQEGLRVVVLFEGRDAAGKGGVIKRITQRLNPRIAKVVALGTPTEKEAPSARVVPAPLSGRRYPSVQPRRAR